MGKATAIGAVLELYDKGLTVIPAVAEDGKSVAGVVSGFQKWRRPLSREKTEELFTKHPGACIALLVGHCGLVVVDCDSDEALIAAEARFGYSPILVRTPSGRGGHLYYRAPAEPVRQANLRGSDGLAIDIKAGKGAYVIAPPSVRPSNGIPYRFERGSWDDLPNLPTYNTTAKGPVPRRLVEDGGRGDHLFHRALELARSCETCGELEMKLLNVNEAECNPPMEYKAVERAAASAWGYQERGENRIGLGRYVTTTEECFELLADESDAFTLDMRMRLNHERLRATFCASPKGMAAGNVMPGWTARRYRAAIKVLVERSIWVLLKKGGRHAHDPSEYGFTDCSKKRARGSISAPNTNKTPHPPISSTDRATWCEAA
jgi:hypothetical protein